MKNGFIKTIVFLLPLLLFLNSCGEGTPESVSQDKHHTHTYTCPMHPQVVQERPGSCPVCGMDLVVVKKGGSYMSLTLDSNQIMLANISTMQLGESAIDGYKQLNARLSVNPGNTEYISSRVPGRVEKLYVRQTGERVSKGQPLYRIYSEELASLQKEYLLAQAQVNQFPDNETFKQLQTGARQRLMLYGQSESQLKRLHKGNGSDPYITYLSPAAGTVAELSITEGQYVEEGSPILRLEQYGSLWVEADVYPHELGDIKEGERLKVVVPGWEGRQTTMKVEFITPVLQPGSQVYQVRGTIENAENSWQPGLQAQVFLPASATSSAITVPSEAVIRDGNGAHVWIRNAKGDFEPRIVQTRQQSAGKVEISEGIRSGDQVVVSGAYLLTSEFILKKGKNPSAQLTH